MTTAWRAQDVCKIAPGSGDVVPLVTRADRSGLAPGRVYWDMWPIQAPCGGIADCAGRELWMALSAPERGDPSLRHFEAKIRLLERRGGRWLDHGDVLPPHDAPYEREWAGSAVCERDRVSLYFTAAGTSARPGGYQQRLFEAHATLGEDGLPHGWSVPLPSVTALRREYQPADAHEGEAGKIKAFRDPAFFRDPADGRDHLVFTASLAGAESAYNGAVGIARRGPNGWELRAPLIHAAGVNNELERAHVVHHAGRYYVFWATQRCTFAPSLRHAPNGLYGMVADSLFGDYRPLNGTGLVLANPDSEPVQTYSWFVTGELLVSSFVDFWGMAGAPVPSKQALANAHFGGVPAPLLKLEIAGDSCRLAGVVPV